MSQPVYEGATASNKTSTAAVTTVPCKMLGFYVNSTNVGTIVFRDGGSGGTVLNGAITPAIGWHRFPALISTSLHATIAGTALDVSILYVTG